MPRWEASVVDTLLVTSGVHQQCEDLAARLAGVRRDALPYEADIVASQQFAAHVANCALSSTGSK